MQPIASEASNDSMEETRMDKRRKHAYRYLLYWAMLDIRPIASFGRAWQRSWNPFSWRRDARRIQYAGAIADWMHNLALYASLNFEKFDENMFWHDFESLRARYSDFGPERYRDRFDDCLGVTVE